jgi:hypothetical protein
MAETALRWVWQAAAFGLLALVIGVLSNRPTITHFPPEMAQIKTSFSHGAQRREECRRLSAEEIAALPPNMRRPLDCARERLPVVLELRLGDALLYHALLPPSGIAGDGPARVYQRFTVPPGRHELVARLRDSDRTDGFDYEHQETVELAPLQSLAVEFRAETGGFIFR